MNQRILLLLSILASSHLAPYRAFALDIPHNTQQCAGCHTTHNAASNFLTTDPAGINALCQSCHFEGGPATPADTHRSATAQGGKYTFSTTCNTCHDPHTQSQTYKKFIKTTVITPNSGSKTVVLNAATGPKSFADGDATYDGICEVCHTQTTHHRNSNSGGDHTHNAAANCSSCHKHDDTGPNNFGFRAAGGSCVDCHTSVQNTRRPVIADFSTAGSHHITAGRSLATKPLNKYDCVICHLEGDSSGNTTAFHNDALLTVNLRDVDDASNESWSYQDNDAIVLGPNADAEISDVTKFCIRCHDNNGVGDSVFMTALAANDTIVTRTATSPFNDGALLGSATSPDINTQFSPANFASHSIKNRWNTGGTGCGGACLVGQHPNHTTGVCTADETCPGTCTQYQSCSITSGNRSCLCTLGAVAACNACATGYSGTGCTTYTDTCPGATLPAACANGHGACVNVTAVSAKEQIVQSNAVFAGTFNGWTLTADATANNSGGTANVLRHPVNTNTATINFNTVGAGLTFNVWVAASREGNTSLNLTIQIDAQTAVVKALAKSWSSTSWISVGTATLASSGAHTIKFTCVTGVANSHCNIDGFMLTTETTNPQTAAEFTPYAIANWDAAALDFYNAAIPAAKSCQCNTGYTGAGCLACASGYHLQGGACVLDTVSPCAGQTCSGNGTCYLATGSTAMCACNERFYGASALTCNLCSSSTAAWESGQQSPTTPGIRAAAFSNGWLESSTTECFDCHSPGNLGAAKPYSNNGHGSVNSKYMLDSMTGTDAVPVGTSSGAGTNVVCMKCHAMNSYVTGTLNTRYPDHDQTGNHLDETRNFFGLTMGTKIGCFNCHAGGSLGAIHGENQTITDDGGLGTINGVLFFNGAGLDYWAGGPSITCSSRKSTNAWNLGCTQHSTQGYTRGY